MIVAVIAWIAVIERGDTTATPNPVALASPPPTEQELMVRALGTQPLMVTDGHLMSNGREEKAVFYNAGNGVQRVALIDSGRISTQLNHTFAQSTTLRGARMHRDGTRSALCFQAEDGRWITNYCWEPERDRLYFRADDKRTGKRNWSRGLSHTSVEARWLLNKGESTAEVRVRNTPEIARSATPAVVTVYTGSYSGAGQGSGFFIRSNGLLVTNWHVIDGAQRAGVVMSNGREYWVDRIVASNPQADVAILQVSLPAGVSVPTVPLARVPPSVGEEVVVIGSPRNLSETVSEGIVSGNRENGYGVPYLQITAPITNGSSGGPVLNRRGEVVGIASAVYKGEGNINFAVRARAIWQLIQ